jgi:site-specific DNA recombinase
MKMAAIYARVSSEQQREEKTIASQTAALIEFAKTRGLQVPTEWVFEDEGFSGATLERPGLERVRDLAAEGQIQVVLAYSPDRLSRKYAYQILLMEELAKHGVETLFVNAPQGTSAEDQLLVQFQGMIAEYERAQILERSRRGKRHRARSGEVSVLSGAPYGYRYVCKTQETPAFYQVIDAESHVVQRVYEMYTVASLSIGEITRRLNAQGVPTRKLSSRWERSVIWAMLRNPAYRGAASFGKTRVAGRVRVTRAMRRRGGFVSSDSVGHEQSGSRYRYPRLSARKALRERKSYCTKTKCAHAAAPSHPVLRKGWSVVRNAGMHSREPQPTRPHARSIITNALALIVGASLADRCATTGVL